MLNESALQDSGAGLNRRIKHYVHPQLLCIDEVGYLSYDSRYADLPFEVVTRRYEALKPGSASPPRSLPTLLAARRTAG